MEIITLLSLLNIVSIIVAIADGKTSVSIIAIIFNGAKNSNNNTFIIIDRSVSISPPPLTIISIALLSVVNGAIIVAIIDNDNKSGSTIAIKGNENSTIVIIDNIVSISAFFLTMTF